MTKILVLDPHAEIYRDRLQAEFPTLQFVLAHKASELPADIADIDVLISFGIELKDEFYRRAARLKWVQCLATGVDHVLRCPSLEPETLLTSGRGIHGVPMRETIVFLMMGVARDARRLAEAQKAHRLGAALLELVFRQNRRDRRRRRHRHRNGEAAQGVRDEGHRRHPHAARDRRF